MRKQVECLLQAKTKLEEARKLLNEAFGGTDVGDDYSEQIDEILHLVHTDLTELES